MALELLQYDLDASRRFPGQMLTFWCIFGSSSGAMTNGSSSSGSASSSSSSLASSPSTSPPCSPEASPAASPIPWAAAAPSRGGGGGAGGAGGAGGGGGAVPASPPSVSSPSSPSGGGGGVGSGGGGGSGSGKSIIAKSSRKDRLGDTCVYAVQEHMYRAVAKATHTDSSSCNFRQAALLYIQTEAAVHNWQAALPPLHKQHKAGVSTNAALANAPARTSRVPPRPPPAPPAPPAR